MTRILSISGLRGIVGDGLEPDYVVEFAMALGTMFDGGTVVVGRDGRSSGVMLESAVHAGLMATGCRVVDAGIASTPTCGVLVDHLGAAGGVQITASHNPIEWNGLKPFSSAGGVFDQELGRRLIEILESRAFRPVAWDRLGTIERCDDAAAPHLERVLRLVDAEAIRRRRLKVVLDCNHGSGGVLGPRLLESLGCEMIVLGGTSDGRFEHTPEPIKENLTGLCDAVRHHAADIGFAQDPDADRLAIVDNTGRYIGEELTLALCVDHVLSQPVGQASSLAPQAVGQASSLAPHEAEQASPPAGASGDACPTRAGGIVVNASTSRVTADIAAKYGRPFHRAHVGEANVVAKMKEVSALIGGEGNGGVIEPKVGYVRDSFVGMAYVLAGLAAGSRTLAEWADALPQYTIVKEKLTCPRERVAAACDALRNAYPDADAEQGDGLRLDWPGRWVQVRASNTEPILRVIAEAPDETTARRLCADAVRVVREAVARDQI